MASIHICKSLWQRAAVTAFNLRANAIESMYLWSLSVKPQYHTIFANYHFKMLEEALIHFSANC